MSWEAVFIKTNNMANTSTIHIKTDFDCKVFDYGQEIGTTKADTYCNFELRKGEHELTFAYTEDESISKTISYNVDDADCDNKLDLEIAENICNKAQELYESKDYSHAFFLFSTAAEKGFAFAQNSLGKCYFSGKGVEKNLNKAAEWYTKAAEQGYAEAECNLGFCYRFGNGITQNLAKAVEWFTKSAEQGYALAQYLLGRFNKYGELIKKDHTKAFEWYSKAAEQGMAQAQYSLGCCFFNGEGVEKDLAKAAEWFTKAAEQEYADSEWAIARCYYYGDGVKKDLAKTAEWVTKIAEQGNATAQEALGQCYYVGNYVEKDASKAVEWWTKAAEQGIANAQYNLGYCYFHGEGVEKDLAKAAEWWTKVAEQGVASAQFNLGCCYEKGNGVIKDLTKAIEWYNKAAEQGHKDANNALNRLRSIEAKPINYLFFDTETAGLPRNYNAPTHHIMNWPRLVQLSWITTDADCNVLSQNDHIIYPDGFTIPEETACLHGITTAIAKEKGEPLREVIDKFLKDFKAAKTIVGHNIDFDKNIVGAELIRLGLEDIMNSKESLCTMKGSTEYCKIPGSHGYKWPKLQELHKKLFGYEFEDAHNSMSDVTATLKCFKEMKEKGLYGDKWLAKSSRAFTADEIACVERSEVVESQYGKSVYFHLVGGSTTFLPLTETSSVGVGEPVDLRKAKLITLGKFRENDILRIEA